jgi:hypothetical protein
MCIAHPILPRVPQLTGNVTEPVRASASSHFVRAKALLHLTPVGGNPMHGAGLEILKTVLWTPLRERLTALWFVAADGKCEKINSHAARHVAPEARGVCEKCDIGRGAGTMGGSSNQLCGIRRWMIHDTRARKPRDVPMNGGIQPENISRIHRHRPRPCVALPLSVWKSSANNEH